jgi:hypothetical protein
MTTKLKIDLSQGILEVEGSESFVKLIYSDFKTHFAGIETVEEPKSARRSRKRKTIAKTTPPKPAPEPVVQEEKVKPAPKKARLPTPTYTRVQDLELGAADGRPSLVEFMDAKFPITNEERNIVFLYYLQHTLKVKSITLNHIYTCYRQARIRVPLNLENSLRVTADQHGWIKTTKTGAMTLTPAGKRYVENQLPKKVKN